MGPWVRAPPRCWRQYSDDPGNSGLPRYEQGKLNRMTIERTLAGFQIGFHAIGDRAVQMALDAFAEAERSAKENDRAPTSGSVSSTVRFLLQTSSRSTRSSESSLPCSLAIC